MSLSSYSDVFGITHDHAHGEELLSGDHVCTGPNDFPRYEVIAVSGDKAWVRNLQSGADHLALAARCRKIVQPSQRLAAE